MDVRGNDLLFLLQARSQAGLERERMRLEAEEARLAKLAAEEAAKNAQLPCVAFARSPTRR